MRAEMRRLGHAAEAKAAKGPAAVREALEAARASPREVEAEAEAEASGSDDESGASDDGDVALAGDDLYEVKDILAKRRCGGVTEYRIRWKGWSAAHDTWEPTAHVPPALIREFLESRIGLEEETDNDDSDGEEDAPPPPPPPPAAPPAAGQKCGAAPAAPPRGALMRVQELIEMRSR